MEGSKMLHIVMYPWFAYGHMIPYIHLANKLAERGHQVTLLLPNRAKNRLQYLNLHPSFLTFRAITVPHVPPLPLGTEDANDVDLPLVTHLATAFDLTQLELESTVTTLTPKPDLIFYDLAYWVPQLGIKSVCYNVISANFVNIMRKLETNVLFGEKFSFTERTKVMLSDCDAIAFRTCREVEGESCDELSRDYGKPCLFTGAVLPKPDKEAELPARLSEWLARFEIGSVVFCAFGSYFCFEKLQFQELLLGLEMMNRPFLLAVRPPKGCASIEEAYPEGFKERVGDGGVVTSEWVQQQLLLAHPSVGCFVNHCGYGTMWESLLSKNKIVLIPQIPDQVMGAEMLANKMKVGVQVERGVDGWFSKESLCNAIEIVMNENNINEIGSLINRNQNMWREKLGAPGFMDAYFEIFIKELQALGDKEDHYKRV